LYHNDTVLSIYLVHQKNVKTLLEIDGEQDKERNKNSKRDSR